VIRTDHFKDYAAGGLRLGCILSRNEHLHRAIRGGVCRFSSPSSLSMAVATTMLEDRAWMKDFLLRSQEAILEQRLLTERVLDEAGIAYYRRG
jgi:1-aminocyclopropane-1-carboxylate synthase